MFLSWFGCLDLWLFCLLKTFNLHLHPVPTLFCDSDHKSSELSFNYINNISLNLHHTFFNILSKYFILVSTLANWEKMQPTGIEIKFVKV